MQRVINARVMPMEGPGFESGYVAFNNGKITAVGPMADIAPAPGDLDAAGGFVLPGYVEAHSHMGLRRENEASPMDTDEKTEVVAAHVNARDGFYPPDPAVGKAMRAGITTVMVSPTSASVVGGQICALKTWGSCVDKMIALPFAGMKAAVGEAVLASRGAKKKMPTSRMGTAAVLRKVLDDAARFGENRRAGKDEYDPKLEAMLPVMEGRVPLFVRALRRDDIETVLRATAPYPALRLVLLHAFDCEPVADQIRARAVPVIAGPLLVKPRDLVSERGGLARPDVPKKLYDAGIPFAISTFNTSTSMRSPVPAWFCALHTAAAVRSGLPEAAALRAVTIEAAKICGLDKRVGSLVPGKDADVVLFSGHPLDYKTRVKAVYVDGVRRA